jgi:hypothetical protein
MNTFGRKKLYDIPDSSMIFSSCLWTHFGLDKHMDNSNKDDSDSSHEESEVKAIQDKPATDTKKASYASYASYGNSDDKPRMYFSAGNRHCENCSDKGDKYYMEVRKCNDRKVK